MKIVAHAASVGPMAYWVRLDQLPLDTQHADPVAGRLCFAHPLEQAHVFDMEGDFYSAFVSSLTLI